MAQGLAEKRAAALFATGLPLGAGHLLAMALVLVPFALLAWLLEWGREIRIAAGAAVLLFGVAKLFMRRHPRWMARIPPTQLVLWSFLMASAHGAALMLLPVLLGLCEAPAAGAAEPAGHDAVMALMRSSLGTAVAVSLQHSAAIIVSGLALPWVVYRYLGLRALRAAWFDLDRVWAASLIVSGAAGLTLALSASP